jgi:hypothetical protein
LLSAICTLRRIDGDGGVFPFYPQRPFQKDNMMTPITFDPLMLWPVIWVAILTLASGIYLFLLRRASVLSQTVKLSFYRVYRGGEEPEHIAAATRHYTNLFETPVLFYLGVICAGLLGPATWPVLVPAFAFAALRTGQSLIHLTSNNVLRRAYCFWASALMLMWLWGAVIARTWTATA